MWAPGRGGRDRFPPDVDRVVRGIVDGDTGRHRAGLNYGDSFSYALATVLGEPLLFKGDDLGQTDVEPVEFSASS